MKKLLLILLCLPMIGFGQTAKEYFLEAKKQRDNKQYQLAIDSYTQCINLLKNEKFLILCANYISFKFYLQSRGIL